MIIETFKTFTDFKLLDSGNGFRLEQWGGVVLVRPDPQIIWPRSLPDSAWENPHASFIPASEEGKGKWEIAKPLPKPWIVKFQDTSFLLKLSPFKHTGLFAEQAANWEWMKDQISNNKYKITNTKPAILNLFAYTGGATMVLAKAGCQVTHVDASKAAITRANENHGLNHLEKDSVRWILDDVVKFVKREVKRGTKYEGIIMDPPAFGHSPTGKTWKFNRDLPELLRDCVELLSPDAKFLVVNGYATNSSALALHNILEDSILNIRGGALEFGELCLKQTTERLISTGIFARWAI